MMILMGQRCSRSLMGSWSLPLFESVKMKTPTNIDEPKWTYPGTAAPCNCRRQRNSWLASIPASRATADATAPGSIAAATMRSFSALDHLRRCRTEITVSACVFVIGSSINSSPLMRSSDFAERLSVALHVGPEVPTRSRPYDAASDRARRSPLALEAGGEAFRGLAGRSLAHRAGYAERSAEQLLLRAQRGQPLFVRARNIGTQ